MKSDMPWYTELFNPELLREVIGDSGEYIKNETKAKYDKNPRFGWKRKEDGYQLVLETPGITKVDMRIQEGQYNWLWVEGQNHQYDKEYLCQKKVAIPVQINDIDEIEYETMNGLTVIFIKIKDLTKNIKFYNRGERESAIND